MTSRHLFAIIAVTAAATYALRAVPLALFRKPFGNRFATALLDCLPYALLAAMIFPAIFYSTDVGASYPSAPTLPSAAGAITAVVLGFMGLSLPVVALASTIIAYLFALV